MIYDSIFSTNFIDKVYYYNSNIDYIDKLYSETKSIILSNTGMVEIYNEDLETFVYLLTSINDSFVKISKIQTFLYFSEFYISNYIININSEYFSKIDINVYYKDDTILEDGFLNNNGDDNFSKYVYYDLIQEKNEKLVDYRNNIAKYLNVNIASKLNIDKPDDLIVVFRNDDMFVDSSSYINNLDIYNSYNVLLFLDNFQIDDILTYAKIFSNNYNFFRIKLDNIQNALYINKNTKEYILDKNIFIYDNLIDKNEVYNNKKLL